MKGFTPGRVQDAASVIHGFKYQIQHTLLRWLDLADDEILYLECGEDIDRVLRADDQAAVQRELEQVKSHGRNLTLVSEHALTALANFAAHIKSNPGARLRFRFTTSAKVGRERMSPLGKAKAIEVWNRLGATGEWSSGDKVDAAALSTMLRSATRPGKCDAPTWQLLLDIAAGSGVVTFRAFVTAFEWCCDQPANAGLTGLLLDRIGAAVANSDAHDPGRQQRYEQLMARLLDTLSQSGVKRLDRNALLTELNRPTLTQHDRARLAILEERSDSQAALMSELEGQFAQVLLAFAPITSGQGLAELKPATLLRALPEPASLSVRLAQRSETVNALSPLLEPRTWLAIHGAYGTGKSHLSYLVAKRHGGVVLGWSMRGLQPLAAEIGLRLLMHDEVTHAALMSKTPGVVVLDDVPECNAGTQLEHLLAIFAKAVLATGRSLISSSRGALPQGLAQELGTVFRPRQCPPFTDSDAAELLRAHELQDPWLSADRVALLNVSLRGHPMLLSALARHLRERPENPDKELMEAIATNKYREQLDLEVARVIFDSVEAAPCRTLLYRLALANFALDVEEIRVIAAAPPALPEPTACVARLDGLWLDRSIDARFQVSALATQLGRDLPEEERKATYSKVARVIFSRKALSTSDFIRAIMAMLGAGEQTGAAVQLVLGCMHWPNRKDGYGELGVLFVFPPADDHGLRPGVELPLRGAQAVTAAVEGEDPKPYVARIQALLTSDGDGVAIGGTVAGSMMLTSGTNLPIRLLTLAASMLERFGRAEEVASPPHPAYDEGAHLLIPIGRVGSWDDLDAFLDLMASLPEERRVAVASSMQNKIGMQSVVYKSMFDTKGELTADAFERLGMVERRCEQLGLTLMGSHAAAGRLVIVGEYERDVARLRRDALDALNRYSANAIAVSVLRAELGHQLFLKEHHAEALEHLRAALSQPDHIRGLVRAYRLIDAMAAAREVEADFRGEVADLARQLDSGSITSPENLCQLHAQLAVCLWQIGERSRAFEHYEKALVFLLDLPDSARERQLATGLAHSVSYCMMLLDTGEPPSKACDGSPYPEPRLYMFSGQQDAMAAMWHVRQGYANLQWLFSRLASLLGRSDSAAAWTERAQDAAMEDKVPGVLSLFTIQNTGSAVRASDWATAVEAAIVYGRAKVVVADGRYEGAKLLDDDVEFDPLTPPTSSEHRRDAEIHAMLLLSRTLACEVPALMASTDGGSIALRDCAKSIATATAACELTDSWRKLAEVIELAASDNMTVQSHKDAIELESEPGSGSPHFLAHALLSLRKDARLGQAAVSHLGVLQRLESDAPQFDLSSDGYARAVCTYWREAIERSAFRFRNPSEVRHGLTAARSDTPRQEAKAVLRVVFRALSIPTDDNMRQWLSAMP